jgi:cytochrome c-type biogenesis protein CcmH
MADRTPDGWRRRIKGPIGWGVIGVVAFAALVVGALRSAEARTPEERVEAISKRVACPICDGESVFESRNNASSAIRVEITRQVAAGELSDDDIVSFLVASYDEDVSLLPKASGIDALVWVLPVVAFTAASVGLGLGFRRWRGIGHRAPSDDDRQLVEDALAAAAAVASSSSSEPNDDNVRAESR